MNLEKVLTQLREELANVDAAILSLERLQEVSGIRRRGRTPKARSDASKSAPSASAAESADHASDYDT